MPRIRKLVLDTGLTLMLREDHAVPLVAVEIRARAGSIWEPAGKEGLASLTALKWIVQGDGHVR